MVADAGQLLDHDGDAIKSPQLPGEAVGGGAVQERLFDGGELGVRQPGRRAAGPATAQGVAPAGLPAGVPDADRLGRDLELAGDLGLADAGGEQLGRAEPAGLQAVTFSLCRGAARDSWHAPDPRLVGSRAPTPPSALNATPKAL